MTQDNLVHCFSNFSIMEATSALLEGKSFTVSFACIEDGVFINVV